MSDADKPVECRSHGTTPATFTCSHIANGVGCGWFADDDETDPWPDAWCAACESIFQREGGWTDASMQFVDLTLLCTHCYEEGRARNRQGVTSRLDAPATAEQRESFVAGCIEHLTWLNEDAEERFGLGKCAEWAYDADTSMLSFGDPANVQVLTEVIVLGSYSTATQTWAWAWSLPDSDENDAEVRRLRVFGEVRGFDAMCDPEPRPAAIEDAWEHAAVAAALLGGAGVYRAPMDHLYHFMLMRDLRRLA